MLGWKDSELFLRADERKSGLGFHCSFARPSVATWAKQRFLQEREEVMHSIKACLIKGWRLLHECNVVHYMHSDIFSLAKLFGALVWCRYYCTKRDKEVAGQGGLATRHKHSFLDREAITSRGVVDLWLDDGGVSVSISSARYSGWEIPSTQK